jgi:hypothetical protein
MLAAACVNLPQIDMSADPQDAPVDLAGRNFTGSGMLDQSAKSIFGRSCALSPPSQVLRRWPAIRCYRPLNQL